MEGGMPWLSHIDAVSPFVGRDELGETLETKLKTPPFERYSFTRGLSLGHLHDSVTIHEQE